MWRRWWSRSVQPGPASQDGGGYLRCHAATRAGDAEQRMISSLLYCRCRPFETGLKRRLGLDSNLFHRSVKACSRWGGCGRNLGREH
ncbi:hypothetical protein MRX96_051825 [Rhipicephalus microplus]